MTFKFTMFNFRRIMSSVLPTCAQSTSYRDPSSNATTGYIEFIQIFCLGLAIWFFNHAYVGIDIHDAKLYAVLAAHWQEQTAYARDPFFLFGSQDDFSIFSPAYGTLVRWFGLGIAAQVIVISGAILLALATTSISVKLFPSRWAKALAVMLCTAATFAYSPGNLLSFRINEEFATARSIAVPLGLLAVALCLHRKFRAGVVTAILATLVHPLMGVWSLLTIISVTLRDRTLLSLIGAGIAVVAGLTFFGMSAFQPLDAEWDRLLRPLSVVYVAPWPNIRLGSAFFWIALLLLGGRYGHPDHRRWYQGIALLSATGLLAAQFASYFYPIKLLLQIQPWRSMWLAIFFALFAAVELLEEATRRGKIAVLWFMLGTLLIYLAHDLAGYALFACWLLMQSSTIQGVAGMVGRHRWASRRNLTVLLPILAIIALPFYLLDLEQLANGLPLSLAFLPSWLSGAFLAGGVGLGFLLIALSAAPWLGRKWFALLLATLLFGALSNWDQRLPATRAWESILLDKKAQSDMTEHIHRGDIVYWHENAPMRTWFELGTASYASGIQPAGSIFSREKTFELKRRLERVGVASKLEFVPTEAIEENRILAHLGAAQTHPQAVMNIFNTPGITTPTGPGIAYLCQDPMLDWIVSSRDYTNEQLTPIRTVDRVSGNALYLYRCNRSPTG